MTKVNFDQPSGGGVSSGAGNALTGQAQGGVGVSGSTKSTGQNALFGINTATGPATPSQTTKIAGRGVWGHTSVTNGTGVVGSTEPNVTATGVLGIGNGAGTGANGTSPSGVGVSGETQSSSQSAIFGINTAVWWLGPRCGAADGWGIV